MKKTTDPHDNRGIRPEYDFSSMKGGVRGKHYEQYRAAYGTAMNDQDRWNFLEDEFLMFSINAAIVRGKDNPTYALGCNNEPNKKQLHAVLRRELRTLRPKYEKKVDDGPHLDNISALASKVSGECKSFLKDGVLRIGRAQKALNLYLKYLWCAQKIVTPPHCPFDNRVIGRLPTPFSAVAWTKIKTRDEYRELVSAAKRVAGDDVPLSVWELCEYQKTRQ